VVHDDGVGDEVVRDGVGDAVVWDGVGDAVADRLTDGVGDADRLADGDALVGGGAPLQATPFTVNAVGLL
jgi:hypothetical protein